MNPACTWGVNMGLPPVPPCKSGCLSCCIIQQLTYQPLNRSSKWYSHHLHPQSGTLMKQPKSHQKLGLRIVENAKKVPQNTHPSQPRSGWMTRWPPRRSPMPLWWYIVPFVGFIGSQAAFTKLHFALTDTTYWTIDYNGFNYEEFYEFIIDFFEREGRHHRTLWLVE